MMENMITVGIIGAGRIGKLHAENLINSMKGMRVKTIVDPLMNDDIKRWAENLGIEKTSTDADEIFQDDGIDAVFICSPTDTHVDYIIKSAKEKKHIFCEKPLGSDPKKIQMAMNAVEQSGVKMQVGFVRRFDHNHKAVAAAVEQGKIGDVEIVKITSRDPEPPSIDYVKRSGGLFFDMMIHDIDMARYLSGSEVVKVYANGTAKVNPNIATVGDVDTAIVTLTFENGAIGVIDNSRRASYGYDQRTEVHGSLGCVKTENDTANLAMISTANGVMVEKPLWFFLERYNDAFITEVEDFKDAILHDAPIPVTIKDGLMNVIIAKAATISCQEDRPVKISEVING